MLNLQIATQHLVRSTPILGITLYYQTFIEAVVMLGTSV